MNLNINKYFLNFVFFIVGRNIIKWIIYIIYVIIFISGENLLYLYFVKNNLKFNVEIVFKLYLSGYFK